MAITYTDNGGGAPNGSDKEFTYTFPVIQTEDVKVSLNGVTQATTKYAVDTASNPTKITFNNTSVDSSVQESTGAPKTGVLVRVYRQTTVGKSTGDDDPKAVYAAGSSIRAVDLNANTEQALYALHELQEQPIETPELQNDSVTSDKIADDQIDSEHYVDGSIDTQHIGADQITNALIANDQIDSEHYVDGSIDEQHIANSAVTSNKIANNAVTTNEIFNGAVTNLKLATNSVDSENIINNSVDANKLNQTSGSEAVVTAAIRDDAVTNAKVADNAIHTEQIADGQVDAVKLNQVSGSEAVVTNAIRNDAVTTAKIDANAVTTNEIANDAVTAAKIADAVIVTNSEQASHSVNDTTFFTTAAAEARYFNASTGETIKNGDAFPDNDTTIATTAAINDRIVDLVEEVGGFRPIANELSFPASNPDVNSQHGQDASRMGGTIISVKTATTNLVPSGTTVTIANGRGTGLAVILTGVPSTIPSGFGFLVETTSTDHTYAFHRLSPKATEVTTVAGKATEIGRLGTADAVADMAILGTADVVSDLNTLGTADVVSDMNALAVSDVISDMNTLAVTSVINDMDTVATNVTNVNNVGGSIANVNTTAGSIGNVNTVAGSIGNVNTVGGAISNVNTTAGSISNVNSVASNMANVNNFADRYQIASNNPSTDGGGNALAAGDLYFNTSANELKVYNGSAWQAGVTATGNFALTTGNTFTGDNRYNDNVKLKIGTGSDIEIYHDTSNSYIQNSTNALFIRSDSLQLYKKSTSERYIVCAADAAVKLFYDNSLKLETTSTGIKISSGASGLDDILSLDSTGNSQGHGGKIGFRRAGDLRAEIQAVKVETSHNETDIVFKTTKTGSLFEALRIVGDTKNIQIPNDTGKLQLGAGQDLELYHDGTLSYIKNNTAKLVIRSDTFQFGSSDGTHRYIDIPTDEQGVSLFYDDSMKLKTQADGVEINGSNGLQVYGGTGTNSNANISLYPTGSGAYSNLFFYNAAGTSSSSLSAMYGGSLYISSGTNAPLTYRASGTGDHVFETNSVERMRIDDANIKLPDSQKINFGAGNDLQIYHDGTNSVLHNSTGNLYLYGGNGAIYLRPSTDDEHGIVVAPNGQVELYHNGIKTAFTDVDQWKVYGRTANSGMVEIASNQGANNNDRFRIHKTSASSTLSILNYTSGAWESNLKAIGNASVELYYDNTLKFETTTNGVKVRGINSNIQIQPDTGSGYATLVFKNSDGTTAGSVGTYGGYIYYQNVNHLFHFGSQYRLIMTGTEMKPYGGQTLNLGASGAAFNNVYGTTFYGDGSNLTGINTDLVADTSPQLGGQLYTNGYDIFFADSEKAKFGNATDLQIYHDGAASRIVNSTGNLLLDNATGADMYLNSGNDIYIRPQGSDNGIKVIGDGAVELYWDSSLKARTDNNGFVVDGRFVTDGDYNYLQSSSTSVSTITLKKSASGADGIDYLQCRDSSNNAKFIIQGGGHLVPGATNASDLGTSSLRWRNIYTNDLHLSNEGHSNDVDGSWGNWTIQEGESDLFLKNNRSGKKYKFNLTEVS